MQVDPPATGAEGAAEGSCCVVMIDGSEGAIQSLSVDLIICEHWIKQIQCERATHLVSFTWCPLTAVVRMGRGWVPTHSTDAPVDNLVRDAQCDPFPWDATRCKM